MAWPMIGQEEFVPLGDEKQMTWRKKWNEEDWELWIGIVEINGSERL